ncbi:MAG: hypothetical protein KBB83_06280 [Alphaproteobacteria bacterium]|nr:hypothetical protein [Alphaproteobacteria bacterium]
MFKFTKKIAIAASFVVLYSGEDVFGSDLELDPADNELSRARFVKASENGKNAIDAMNELPTDVWKQILAEASIETDPVDIAVSCRKFNAVMRDTSGLPQDPNNPGVNNFIKQVCKKIYKDNEGPRRFKNGVLRYTPEDGGAVVELKFSDLANPFCGTFDLSKCGNRSQHVRITTSVEEFFKVRGENEDKMVFLTCPFHVIEQAIQSNPDHPFSKVLSNWDKSKAPIGMFWRMGNWVDTILFDYLESVSMKELSEKNLYENWQMGVLGCAGGRGARCVVRGFRCLFLKNQN